MHNSEEIGMRIYEILYSRGSCSKVDISSDCNPATFIPYNEIGVLIYKSVWNSTLTQLRNPSEINDK